MEQLPFAGDAGEPLQHQFRESIPIFQALADPHRQDILFLLMEKRCLNVKQITLRMNISRPAISHHLKVLRLAGILEYEKLGTEKYYSINTRQGSALCRLSGLSGLLGAYFM